jgi:hypothetical protein
MQCQLFLEIATSDNKIQLIGQAVVLSVAETAALRFRSTVHTQLDREYCFGNAVWFLARFTSADRDGALCHELELSLLSQQVLPPELGA